jgi:hypothetical protein
MTGENKLIKTYKDVGYIIRRTNAGNFSAYIRLPDDHPYVSIFREKVETFSFMGWQFRLYNSEALPWVQQQEEDSIGKGGKAFYGGFLGRSGL